jgi:hypothetical protein
MYWKRVSQLVVACLFVLTVFAVFPASAQDEMPPLPGELVLGDLPTPRGLAFDADGNLFVVVVGSGGELELSAPNPEDPSTEVALTAGLSGRIVSVAPDGTATDVIKGLPSYATPQETLGAYRVIPHGDSLWLVFSTGMPGAFWTDSLVEYDAATLTVKNVINLNQFEAVNDPDGNGYDTNVSDIAWGPDGTLYITDAGGNDLLSWTTDGGLQVVHAWPENPVPTSIEIAENGDFYIGFLGAGLAPGAGKIEHWSGDTLVETFANLNAVTDILLDGDTLYAVEMMIIGEQGPGPGDVVMVTTDGTTVVAGGLIAPFGIAKGPDGALYVTYGTVAFAPGMTGGVVKLSM